MNRTEGELSYCLEEADSLAIQARHPKQVKLRCANLHISLGAHERAQTRQEELESGRVWIVVERKRRFVALPVTEDGVQGGTITARSLTELRRRMPLGLVRSDLQPSELPGVIEAWHTV